MTEIPVFYAPQQVAAPQTASPSASKPAAVVKSWQALGIPLSIIAPEPVTLADFSLAHDRTFVEDILALRDTNGFGNRNESVAKALPWTTGSMLSAARHAIATRSVAVAPCSGFHHAHYDRNRGFCTFNGLMVTAHRLRADGLATRVGILDCDQHFGDGTEDILTRTNARGWVRHVTAHQDYPRNARVFLAQLPGLVASMKDCDVLLYQAGADPHIDDPLGGFLTDDQLAERDAIVFATARQLDLPIAWNLAGGYQEPLRLVLNIHDRTMRACAATYLRD